MSTNVKRVAQKTAVVCALVVGVGLVCAVVVQAWRLWLLLFAATLIALILRSAGQRVQSWTGLSETVSLIVTVLTLLALATGVSVALAPSIAAQARDFAELEPELREQLQVVLDEIPGSEQVRDRLSDGEMTDSEMQSTREVLRRSFSGLIGLVVIVVASLYFTFSPRPYTRGMTRLFPVRYRDKVETLLRELGTNLRMFLLGRVASMLFVAPLTGVMLWLLDVPAAGVLALVAGMLTFVPYAGPITAAVPILLVSATLGPTVLVWAGVGYTIIQAIEGFVITPLVQQRVVDMPPVVTIGAEVVAGTLFGPLGVIVSVPLAVMVTVIVSRAYVDWTLERTEVDRPSPDLEVRSDDETR